MRHNLLLCLYFCLAAIVYAEIHSHNSRKLIGRELRRGGSAGRSSYSSKTATVNWTQKSYASQYKAPSTTKYSGMSGYYTYMGTLYYYNSYYSKEENCLDYLEEDYCKDKDARNTAWKGVGAFALIFFCVAVCCCLCNYSCIMICIREKCKCCELRKTEAFDFTHK